MIGGKNRLAGEASIEQRQAGGHGECLMAMHHVSPAKVRHEGETAGTGLEARLRKLVGDRDNFERVLYLPPGDRAKGDETGRRAARHCAAEFQSVTLAATEKPRRPKQVRDDVEDPGLIGAHGLATLWTDETWFTPWARSQIKIKRMNSVMPQRKAQSQPRKPSLYPRCTQSSP